MRNLLGAFVFLNAAASFALLELHSRREPRSARTDTARAHASPLPVLPAADSNHWDKNPAAGPVPAASHLLSPRAVGKSLMSNERKGMSQWASRIRGDDEGDGLDLLLAAEKADLQRIDNRRADKKHLKMEDGTVLLTGQGLGVEGINAHKSSEDGRGVDMQRANFSLDVLRETRSSRTPSITPLAAGGEGLGVRKAGAEEASVTSVSLPAMNPSTCGNSRRENPEECDDGNVQRFDGCSAFCTVEEGWSCSDYGAIPTNASSETFVLASSPPTSFAFSAGGDHCTLTSPQNVFYVVDVRGFESLAGGVLHQSPDDSICLQDCAGSLSDPWLL